MKAIILFILAVALAIVAMLGCTPAKPSVDSKPAARPALPPAKAVPPAHARVLALARRAYAVRIYIRNGKLGVDVTQGLLELLYLQFGKDALRNGYIDVDGRRYMLLPGEPKGNGKEKQGEIHL